MRTRTWLASVGLTALLAVAGCSGTGSSEGDGEADATQAPEEAGTTRDAGAAGDAGATGTPPDDGAQTSAPAGDTPQADVDGLPEVVAEVNGEEISRQDFVGVYQGQFDQAAAQAQMTGEPVDQDALKEQTVEGMVSNALLVQAADDQQLDASDEEVQTTLAELAEANGLGSVDELFTVLEEQGFPEEEVRAEVESQVKVEKLIAEEGQVEEPTDEELRELYDSVTAQSDGAEGGEGAEPPAFEDVRPQLEEQLTLERESAAVQSLLEELRAEADVTVHL